jgi:hypothetical protein
VALAAGEVSPVLETPSPSDAEVTLVLSTPALSGPGDTATAVETLIVNVEDESAQ